MSEEQMLYCLIAFILGYLANRMMGNGFSVGGSNCGDGGGAFIADCSSIRLNNSLTDSHERDNDHALCSSRWTQTNDSDFGSWFDEHNYCSIEQLTTNNDAGDIDMKCVANGPTCSN